MTRFNNFIVRLGYYRAAGELQRMGYVKLADNLKREAQNLK